MPSNVFFAEQPVEDVEALGPEALVEAQPLERAGERSGIEAADMGAAAHLAADQPGMLQRLDVFRGGGERNRKRFGELAHGAFAVGQLAQHLPARGVAERVEDRVEPVSLLFNHVVECSEGAARVNRLVE